MYSQEPLPCDAAATARERSANVSAWQAWWRRHEPTFQVKTEEAELDRRGSTLISGVSVGAW